jgi:hypothetical protein
LSPEKYLRCLLGAIVVLMPITVSAPLFADDKLPELCDNASLLRALPGKSAQSLHGPYAVIQVKGFWSFGVYGSGPDLTGRYEDQGNSRTKFDLEADLALETENTGIGLHMDYSGPRFGFSLDYGMQDYAGLNTIDHSLYIGGEQFPEGTRVASSLKNSAFDINGTVKFFRRSSAWIGLDLGIQAWYMDIEANGKHEVYGTAQANETVVIPIPQAGISASLQMLENRLVLSGRAHFMNYKEASYSRISADVRYYFLPWLGGRVFWEKQSLDVPPDNGIEKDIQLKLDREGMGFGLVARW